METSKTKSRFSTFPPPRFLPLKTKIQNPTAGLRPQKPTKGDSPQPQTHLHFQARLALEMKLPFQAHLTLESILDFRLISGLENALQATEMNTQ
jgi:hypothetical protein